MSSGMVENKQNKYNWKPLIISAIFSFMNLLLAPLFLLFLDFEEDPLSSFLLNNYLDDGNVARMTSLAIYGAIFGIIRWYFYDLLWWTGLLHIFFGRPSFFNMPSIFIFIFLGICITIIWSHINSKFISKNFNVFRVKSIDERNPMIFNLTNRNYDIFFENKKYIILKKKNYLLFGVLFVIVSFILPLIFGRLFYLISTLGMFNFILNLAFIAYFLFYLKNNAPVKIILDDKKIKFCPICGEKAESDMCFCKKCGHEF